MNNLNNTLIEVRNLYSVYKTNTSKPKFILNDVNIDIPKGKTIALVVDVGVKIGNAINEPSIQM